MGEAMGLCTSERSIVSVGVHEKAYGAVPWMSSVNRETPLMFPKCFLSSGHAATPDLALLHGEAEFERLYPAPGTPS